MTKLEVKDWDATEINIGNGFEDFDIYKKQHNLEFIKNFTLHLNFTVGVINQLGGDYFSVLILSYDNAFENFDFDRRKIILPLFDVEIAQKIVERTVKYVGDQNPDNWGHELSKYFHWEFENMQELTPEQVQEMRDEGLWQNDEDDEPKGRIN